MSEVYSFLKCSWQRVYKYKYNFISTLYYIIQSGWQRVYKYKYQNSTHCTVIANLVNSTLGDKNYTMASIDPWINYPVVNRFLMHIDIWKGPTCSSKLLGVEVKNLELFFFTQFW